jgi:hypothetical protein
MTEQLIGLLSDRITALERERTGLQLEWNEILDKINAWAARQAARDRRGVKASLSDDQPAAEGGEAPPPAALSKDDLRRKAAQLRMAR